MLKKNVYQLALLAVLLFIHETPLHADSQKYPVDISFLVADLKYSEAKGVKICEIQHGILSTFFGDRFSYGNNGNISPHFVKTISQFSPPYWTNLSHFLDDGLKESIEGQQWNIVKTLKQLKSDPIFLANAAQPVENPFDISCYHGLVYLSQSVFSDLDAFRLQFPGVIFMDAAVRNYWVDKYKMSLLFTRNPELSKFKPRWKLYPKKYTSNLAKTIINDLQCDRFVIKPRDEFKGKGVIIVDKEKLDETLKYIFGNNTSLKNDKEACYNYWYYSKSTSFIVEEFASSDPVVVNHLDGKLYEPTIRVAFFLIYNNNSIHIEFCGGYLRVPCKSLTEFGTLNEKYKDGVEEPYFDKIDPAVYEKIKEELSIALPLLYEQMLNSSD